MKNKKILFKKVGEKVKKAELVFTDEEIDKDKEIEIVLQYDEEEEPLVFGVAKDDVEEIQQVDIIYPGDESYIKEFKKDEKDPQWLQEILLTIIEELIWDRSLTIFVYSSIQQ